MPLLIAPREEELLSSSFYKENVSRAQAHSREGPCWTRNQVSQHRGQGLFRLLPEPFIMLLALAGEMTGYLGLALKYSEQHSWCEEEGMKQASVGKS